MKKKKADLKSMFDVVFKDAMVFDPKTKTVVSVRDGVQEYRGHELGLEPADKIFKFYRAPETIKAIVDAMEGLPITDEHVSLDEPPSDVIGKVDDSRLELFEDTDTDSTVKIKNKITLDSIPDNQQLSLGYHASVIDCNKYDFEQVDIVPHHLAIVNKGRCGDICQFTDEESTMKFPESFKPFLDAQGEAINMQQVMQLITDLPEAIKTMPIKDLAKLVPVLQKATATAATTVVEEIEEGDTLTPEQEEAKKIAEAGDATDADQETEDQKADREAQEKKDKEDNDKKFSDSVDVEVKRQAGIFSGVILKAKDFLDDTYDYAGKSADDIMRDCLKTQHNDTFADSELPTAFKLLKPRDASYAKFADSANKGSLSEIGEKEL